MENNEKKVKICPACGAENKEVYRFCNICGVVMDEVSDGAQIGQTTLLDGTPQNEIKAEYSPNKEYMDPKGAVGNAPDFDDVTAAEMFEYTGYNYKLFKIMQKLHFLPGGKKYSWSLFFCGLFFGFFGMAVWYLYHKVYKQALIFLAAGAILFGVVTLSSVVTYDALVDNMPKIINEAAEAYPELNRGNEDALLDVVEAVTDAADEGVVLSVIVSILNLAQFVFVIVMPFFAFNSYKNTAMERIRKAKDKNTVGIFAVGGTNKAITAIIAVILLLVTSIVPLALTAGFASDVVDYMDRNQERIEKKFTYTVDELSGEIIFEDAYSALEI